MKKTYIIAEAGVNHNGDINIAKKLVLEAKKIGADCIKFQTFKTEKLIIPSAPKASYQLKTTRKSESQFEMLKNLELSYDEFNLLFDYCTKLEIDFISTPYNFEDVEFLDSIGVNCFKIASGQLTELPFLRYVAQKNKKIILSTGMSTLAQICQAVDVIREFSKNELIILQCTTNYPSDIEDTNLNCMKTIESACDVSVGYSDHVIGNHACFSAVALGASVIEKHFTLDKSMEGPDHSCSSDPSEFNDLVKGIRLIEKTLGSSIKKPSAAELNNIHGMKRSLVAKTNITKGDILTEDKIAFKRPFNGLPINDFDLILGKKVKSDIEINQPIMYNHIQWKI